MFIGEYGSITRMENKHMSSTELGGVMLIGLS